MLLVKGIPGETAKWRLLENPWGPEEERLIIK